MAKKILGQLSPADTNEGTLYTVPGSKETVISSVSICNYTATDRKFRVRVKVAAAGDADKEWLYYDQVAAANDTYIATVGLTLAAGDLIKIRSDAANALAFQVFGDEKTA